MFEALRQWLCRVFHVPPEPEPPYGAPESVQVFRAGRNYFRLRLLGWGVGQFFALAGILFWVGALHYAQTEWKKTRASRDGLEAPGLAAPPPPTPTPAPESAGTATDPAVKRRNRRAAQKEKISTERVFGEMRTGIARVPGWVFPALWALKLLGIFVYLGQMLVTYAALRLDYELRWYIVTDRSLRIRSGIWSVREMTMSFANLQQIALSQGPLQRLLGIADVRVQSAGGGGGGHHQHGRQHSLHTGFFHGVENATGIRDLIIERLRRFRETGLGDPDEAHARAAAAVGVQTAGAQAAALAAAVDLLAAARELRQTLATRSEHQTP